MTLVFRHAALTDTRRVRTRNEDRWVADPEIGLYLVVDGMGGRLAGSVAAEIVAETFPQQVRGWQAGAAGPMNQSSVGQMQALLCQLNDALVEQTRGEFGLEGLGATLVALLVRGAQGLVAHLGDCRAYLLRGGKLTLLTRDHTIVQLLLDRGEIQPEEAADHPARHQVTRFVGMEETPPTDVRWLDLQPGDRMMLCSDGLSGMVDEECLSRWLALESDPAKVCGQLVAAANGAGGDDNITVVVVDAGSDQP